MFRRFELATVLLALAWTGAALAQKPQLGIFGNTAEGDAKGVIVSEVVEKSPADAAGIKVGDRIVSFDGQAIDTYEKLAELIAKKKAGDDVKIKVVRDDGEKELTAKLGEAKDDGKADSPRPPVRRLRPDTETRPFLFPSQEPAEAAEKRPMIGVTLQPLTDELKEKLGVDHGIVIADVWKGSPAEKAELKTSDVIVQIDGKDANDRQEVVDYIRSKKAGDSIKLVVRRGQDRLEKTVKLEEMTPPSARVPLDNVDLFRQMFPDGDIPFRFAPIRPDGQFRFEMFSPEQVRKLEKKVEELEAKIKTMSKQIEEMEKKLKESGKAKS